MKKGINHNGIDGQYTPMIMQYIEIKKKHPEILIFFRLGDFYELFFDDANVASRELQLFLTSKAAGNGQKIPMCGIPHHAYLTYVNKLVDKGYKIGIVEQMEDPKSTKNLVKRDVIQIISPGANLEIKDDDNNFIGAISEDEFNYILAYVDLTTGEQYVVNLKKDYRVVLATISNLEIKEIVVGTSFDANLITYLKDNLHVVFSYNNDDETSIEMEALFKYLKDPRQMRCVARLYNYLVDTQKRSLDYFQPVINRLSTKILGLDHSSRTNLELVKNLKGEGSYGTLYWLLNKTSTSMGARLLKSEIEEPSSDILEINKRLDRVEALITNFMVRSDLKKSLESIYDLDRLIGRVGFNSCSGREMLQLKKSLQMVPGIKELLSKLPEECFKEIVDGLGDFNELTDTLERAISIDCPLTITEGGIFNKGYNSQLDELIEISTHGKNWLLDIEQKEKEKTGIKNLKIGYNRVFGYYIEISNSFLNQIDPSWGYIRKQTLTTGERFITEDLKNAESKLLTAQEQRISLENKLFHELRDYVAGFTSQIQALGKAISKLDVSCALAIVSSEGNYVRPTFNEQKIIDVKEARHPVIEKVMPEKEFVSNDYYMDQDTEVLIITGPNMGGKSTYMREFALLVIMAQIGCFVVAKEANLYLFDNIFTRIGASDDLIKGQSTFMVEMSEVNNALKNATENSLILFDEIGRGTATYDGMALAQAILEYLVTHIHAKTFFSTHYHEITSLASDIKHVKNIHVAISEKNGEITFLYKIKDGPMEKSYGINVAQLANLPEELINRSKTILNALEEKKIDYDSVKVSIDSKKEEKDDIIRKEIEKINPLNLSPLEALNVLFELKKKAEIK